MPPAQGYDMRGTVDHLYIHIPFCPSKCSYCAFETHIGSLKLVPDYLDALEIELGRLKARSAATHLQTVYFGGGTPSMLEPADVSRLLSSVDDLFGVAGGAEISLECHPETVDTSKLRAFRAAGVTRISFGAESLNDRELAAVGRRHDPHLVLRLAETCRSIGFDSVALDLMYGLPTQTRLSWSRTLDAAASAGADHLSLYPLSIEPRTVFARRRREGALQLPEDEEVAVMYDVACETLTAAGFEHYEVANWAQPGRRCRHNLAYWHDRQYLGVGVGANGYVHPHRTENVGGTNRYIRRLRSGQSPVSQVETLTPETELAETIMLQLRLLVDGLDLRALGARFDVDLEQMYRDDLRELERLGLIDIDPGREVRLREDAVPVANEVWERFMSTPVRR